MAEEVNSEPLVTRRSRRPLTQTPAGQSIFIALWILGTLATLAALGGAFVLGQYVANLQNSEPEEIIEAPEIPFVVPDLSLGPRPPGMWSFDELRGGECIGGYQGAFSEQYRVVTCASPHGAQIVRTRLLSVNQQTPFPGEVELRERAASICDVAQSLNRAEASQYRDLAVEFSYPLTSEQWDRGQRVVYCFVTRLSGEPLLGSLIG